MKPEQRARKYRLIAGEIRSAARTVAMEESRTSLLNLASAYERMANVAEGVLPNAADERRAPIGQAFNRTESTTHS